MAFEIRLSHIYHILLSPDLLFDEGAKESSVQQGHTQSQMILILQHES